jgi:glycosyltransferase involved in cell wall biosynthesis
VILPNGEQVISGSHIPEFKTSFTKASRAGTSFLYYLQEKLKGYDLVINTYGDFELLNMFADIIYSGLPFSLSYMFPDSAPYPMKNKLIQNAYYIASKSMEFFTIRRKPLILANSTFTRDLLHKFYGENVKIEVLHPPCDVGQYLPFMDFQDKRNIVVTVSRFSRGKRLEIIPYIAKHATNWNFVIAGSTSEVSRETIELVRSEIESLDVKDRVELILNEPRSKIQDAMARAKVYLHLMKNEPFGISIVEAMAFGCVPIIHQSGGAWYDVLEKQQGHCGYGYVEYIEVVDYIKMLEDEKFYRTLSIEARKRASNFNEDLFEKRFIVSFRKALNSKGF